MSFFTLPDANREVHIGVIHECYQKDYDEIFHYKYHASHGFNRCTSVVLTDNGNSSLGKGYLEARSLCKEDLGDNFSKQEGRRRAATNLLKKLRGLNLHSYTKADRRAIFLAVCPEYEKK